MTARSSSTAPSRPSSERCWRNRIIVALVCVVFLMHVRSALVAILMLPVGILMAFIAMRLLGMSSNLMSLGRHCDRHRRDDRRGHRDDRERAQASRTTARRSFHERPVRCHAGGLQGGWPGAVLLAADHHRVVPAGFRARRPGRPPVLAAGLYQDLLDGGRGVAVDHAGAGADAAVHPRKDHARGEKPGEPLPDLGLSTDHHGCHALEEIDRARRTGGAGRLVLPRLPARLGVSCPRSTKALCSICRHRCPACRSPRPPSCCRRRTRSSRASRK
jgi:hypothetical protein